MAEMNGLKWWEKSVEYKFVADILNNSGLDLVWPLSGAEEQIGDAIFFKDALYVIVEFKDEIKSFKSEYRKYRELADDVDGYNDYLNAKTHLGVTDKHFLVAGKIASSKLALDVYRYFECDAENPVPVPNLVSMLTEKGGTLKEIVEYGETLSKYKFSAKEVDESQGGGSSSGGYKSKPKLIGINGNSIMVYDYSSELQLKLKNKIKSKLKCG